MSIRQFEWIKCNAGYTLVDEHDNVVDPEIWEDRLANYWCFRPKSSDTSKIRPFEKDGTLVIRDYFKDGKTFGIYDYLDLVDEYGLISEGEGQREYVAVIYQFVNNLRVLLGRADLAAKAKDENSKQCYYAEIQDIFKNLEFGKAVPRLELRSSGPPIYQYVPPTLRDALYAAFIEMLSREIGHLQCDWCSKWFQPVRKSRGGNNFCPGTKCSKAFHNEQTRLKKLKEKP